MSKVKQLNNIVFERDFDQMKPTKHYKLLDIFDDVCDLVGDEIYVTADFLSKHPTSVFVFGDNTARVGTGGAAKLRHFDNTYGFITKKTPAHGEAQYYYTESEYVFKYAREVISLGKMITSLPNTTFIISKLGGGLANWGVNNLFMNIIRPTIFDLLNQLTKGATNIVYLFEPFEGQMTFVQDKYKHALYNYMIEIYEAPIKR